MELKQKLSSRKFWAMVAGVVTGVTTLFALDQNVVNVVSGAVVALGSVIVYVVTEGKIDAAAVGNAAQKVQDAIDAVTDPEA